jgi:hypothetical protein
MIVRTNLTISGLLGDYNDDGKVDAADYTVWRDAQEAEAMDLTNRDPAYAGLPVSEDDYTVWRDHFGDMTMMAAGGSAGAGGAVPPGAAAVPEPATWTLLLGALGMLLLRPEIRHFSSRPSLLKKRYST